MKPQVSENVILILYPLFHPRKNARTHTTRIFTVSIKLIKLAPVVTLLTCTTGKLNGSNVSRDVGYPDGLFRGALQSRNVVCVQTLPD